MPEVFQTLLVDDRTDRVAVTLHRPAHRNAIDQAMINELHAVCDQLEADPRPLIITGSGGTFAAGADIAQLRDRRRGEALQGINRRLFDRIAKLPAPTVAAVAGPALGGGAELAYACDIRLASPTARFGNPEPGLGILAAAGASWRLSELVGRSVAKQVLLAGITLDAERAHQFGLVADIVAEEDLLGAAHAVVDRMLRSVPLALRLTKLVLDAPGPHPVADDLAQAILFETEEKQERMSKFLDGKQK
jgi:enoyl-CoA hydratase/carnithine racemase